jgi:transcription-repair coupling factor (superfamily II helicase)
VPFDDLPKLWRYGGTAESVTLDRLDGAALAEAPRGGRNAQRPDEATRLLALLREREAARASALTPDAAPCAASPPASLSSRRPTRLPRSRRRSPTSRAGGRWTGWSAAMSASARPEVALRAAAAAALSGKQVAWSRPTTVLVASTSTPFRRRLAPLKIRVEALSRLTPAGRREGDPRRHRRRLRRRRGRHHRARRQGRALPRSRPARHRRGAALRRAGEGGAGEAAREGLHLLTLTATPIPRTLQAAMIGLRDLSVIADAAGAPPARSAPRSARRRTSC